MTIPHKIVANLTKYEKEHGITYVVFSRATIFSDIGIKDGITLNRLCTIIKKQNKMDERKEEEKRLKALAKKSIERFKIRNKKTKIIDFKRLEKKRTKNIY